MVRTLTEKQFLEVNKNNNNNIIDLLTQNFKTNRNVRLIEELLNT